MLKENRKSNPNFVQKEVKQYEWGCENESWFSGDSVSWDCPCRRMSSENQGVRSMDMTWYPEKLEAFSKAGGHAGKPVRKKFTRPATSLCRCR